MLDELATPDGTASALGGSASALPHRIDHVPRTIVDWLWVHLVPRRLRSLLAARFYGTRPPEIWGYVVWGAIGVAIAIPELAAAACGHGFPWRTISTTTGHLEDFWPTFA